MPTTSLGDPEPEHKNRENNGDVSRSDTGQRALAERTAKRQAITSRKRQAATDHQASVPLSLICDLDFFMGRNAATSTALVPDPKLVEARYARAMARKGRGSVRGAIAVVDFLSCLPPTQLLHSLRRSSPWFHTPPLPPLDAVRRDESEALGYLAGSHSFFPHTVVASVRGIRGG
ncbi:hypothetical protein B0H19DRAFT_1086176 [Mycena capillaripes]|nr:hypothetical protein B0H19DRAFT_1086176 [Mycena capillaripes]